MEETAIGCARKKQKGEVGLFGSSVAHLRTEPHSSGQMSLGFWGLLAHATTQSPRRRAMGEREWWIAGMV